MHGRTRRFGLLVVVLALSGCASGGLQGGDGGRSETVLRLNSVETMNGDTVDIEAAMERGETVALIFWQTWCASCKAEAPLIVQAHRDHGQKIRFIGVVPGTDETVADAEVRKTARDWRYGFPQVRDRDLGLTRGLKVTGTPTILVLGKGRQILYDAHRAPDNWTELEGKVRTPDPAGDSLVPFDDAECKDGVCPIPAEEDSP